MLPRNSVSRFILSPVPPSPPLDLVFMAPDAGSQTRADELATSCLVVYAETYEGKSRDPVLVHMRAHAQRGISGSVNGDIKDFYDRHRRCQHAASLVLTYPLRLYFAVLPYFIEVYRLPSFLLDLVSLCNKCLPEAYSYQQLHHKEQADAPLPV